MTDRTRPRPPSALRPTLASLALAVVAGCSMSAGHPAANVTRAASALSASPSPTQSATVATGAAGLRTVQPQSTATFSMDLYHRGDFRSQRTIAWCVPAAIQTMLKVIGG